MSTDRTPREIRISTGTSLRPEAPIRGRDEHLQALDSSIAAVVDGRPGVVLIEGSAGFGKSRLLREATHRATLAGVRVAVGGADPDDRDSPFVPLLAALSRGAIPILSREQLQTLRDLQDERYWFVQELGEILEREAMKRPRVVGLDDLQWADGSTLEAIRTLSGRLASAPILWVLTFRSLHESAGLRRLITEADVATTTTLNLASLDAQSVGEVLADHLHKAPDDAIVGVAAAAEGVPFLLVEIARGLLDRGLVDTSGSVAVLRESTDPPRSMVGVKEWSRRLTLDGRHAAQVAAVLGRSFRGDDVASMLGVAATSLIQVFEELVRADFLIVAGDQWAFRHDIIRQSMLDAMAIPMRRTLERHAADVLLAAGIPPVDIARRVAAGAERGDRRAIDTLAAAARSLMATDPATAAELSEHAYTLTPLDDPLRVTLGSETVVAMHLAGRERDAMLLADEIMKDVSEPEQFGELQLSISTMYSIPGQTRVECGLRGLGAGGISDELRARLLSVLVLSYTASGDVVSAAETASAADALVAATGDVAAELHLSFSRMTLDVATYEYEGALRRAPAIRRLASTVSNEAPALAADWLRAHALVSCDEFDLAWEVSNAAMRFAREHHQAWIASRWEFSQGWFLLQQGRLSDACAVLDGALTAEGLPVATALPDAAAVAALGRVARHVGDQRLLDRCMALANASLALDTADDARRHLEWFVVSQALATGDVASARAILASIGADRRLPVIGIDVGAEVVAVRAGRVLGDNDLAAYAARAAHHRSELNPNSASLAGAAAHARGLLLDDVDSLATASDLLSAGPRPMAECSVLEDLGRTLAARGERPAAVEALGRSLELAMTSGANWDARRIRQRLAALGVRRRVSVPVRPELGWDSLTPAEKAVAVNVGSGMTNRVTAEALFVSPHTVGAHLRHVFEKLEIKSRVELARIVSDRERTAT